MVLRYKSLCVEKEGYLLELSRYIHLNPVRAGLAEKPEGYKWSSYGYYTGKKGARGAGSPIRIKTYKKTTALFPIRKKKGWGQIFRCDKSDLFAPY